MILWSCIISGRFKKKKKAGYDMSLVVHFYKGLTGYSIAPVYDNTILTHNVEVISFTFKTG